MSRRPDLNREPPDYKAGRKPILVSADGHFERESRSMIHRRTPRLFLVAVSVAVKTVDGNRDGSNEITA